MYPYNELTTVRFDCVHFVRGDECKKQFALITATLQAHDILVFELLGNEIKGEQDIFREISTAMSFPDYFGSNWAAVEDCLSDMSWKPAKGYILKIYNADIHWKRNPYLLGTFASVWLSAAGIWANDNIPFHLIFIF